MILSKIRTFTRDIDYFILVPVLMLTAIGLLSIYSATFTGDEEKQFNFVKQLSFLGVGVVLLVTIILTPIRLIDSATVWGYLTAVVLLALILITGATRYGAQRWFVIGPLSVQPSELAKIASILMIARMLALYRVRIFNVTSIVIAFSIAGLPMGLIMEQPDLGTALCIGSVVLPILYWHGISLFSIFVMFSPLVTVLIHIGSGYNFEIFMLTLMIILIILYFSKRPTWIVLTVLAVNMIIGLSSEPLWDSLKDYQKERILTFIEPERDAKGAGYQVLQSKIAIGSGGLAGKGYLSGTQTQLKFLPEQHTDFIFAVVGEEFGLLGGLAVIGLFGVLISRLILIAEVVEDKFCSLTLVGIAALFGFQVFVNIGMTCGIMPVTGIPLPFLSYGGTALLTNFALVGIAVNISVRKKVYDIH